MLHPEYRQAGAGSVAVTATCATTRLSESTMKKSRQHFISGKLLTKTRKETRESLRGSCCWARHRRRLENIRDLPSAGSKLRTRLQHSVHVCVHSRRSWRIEKRPKETHQAQLWRHWAAGERRQDLARTTVPGCKVVFSWSSPSVTRRTRNDGCMRLSERCRVHHTGHFCCSVCRAALAFLF